MCISLLSKAEIAWVFFVKDFRNTYRFKSTLAGAILAPFLGAVSLLVTYSAVFFVGNVDDIVYVNKENYVIFLMTGFLALTFARSCWGGTALRSEKVMMTLDGIFLAPVGRLFILLGKTFSVLFSVMLAAIPYAVIIVLIRPKTIVVTNFVLGFIGLFLMLSIFISADFITSGISLSAEGYASIVRTWVPRGISLLSCVYYPLEVFPEMIRPFVLLNPAYHGVNLFRSAFIEDGIGNPWISFGYLLLLAVMMPPIAVKFFEFLFRRFGVRGY